LLQKIVHWKLCVFHKKVSFLSLKVKVMVKRGCEFHSAWNVINGHPITHPRSAHKKKPESFVTKTKRQRVRYIEKKHVIHTSSYKWIWNDTSQKKHSSMNIQRDISQMILEDQLSECFSHLSREVPQRMVEGEPRNWWEGVRQQFHERVLELWVSKARPISRNRCNPLSALLTIDSRWKSRGWKSVVENLWRTITKSHQSHQSQIGMVDVLKEIMSTLSHLGTTKVHRDKVVESIATSSRSLLTKNSLNRIDMMTLNASKGVL